MKTAKSIVAFVKGQGVGGKVDVDLVDNLLHERAKALRGQPAEKLEWLLAWAVNSVHSASNALRDAEAADAERANDILSKLRCAEPLMTRRSSFASAGSRTDVAAVRLEEADATMRRILDVYEALAVDPPGAV